MRSVDRAGMPRRYIDYPEAFGGWNMLISIGAYLGAASFLFGLGVIIYTLVAGRRITVDHYWGPRAPTLAGTGSSPPPYHTFDTLPRLESPPLASEENGGGIASDAPAEADRAR